METDNGSIFSQLNGLLFARHGRRKSEVTFPEEGGKSDENTTSVSLVRMTKLTKVKESEDGRDGQPASSPQGTVPTGAVHTQTKVDPSLQDSSSTSIQTRVSTTQLATSTNNQPKRVAPVTGIMSGPTKAAAPPPLPPRRPGELPPLSGRRASAPFTTGDQQPPPLPKRNSSLPVQAQSSEFEERFRFHPISSLPPPEPFSEGKKTYPSLMQKSSGDRSTSRDKLPPPPSQPPRQPSQPPPPPPPR